MGVQLVLSIKDVYIKYTKIPPTQALSEMGRLRIFCMRAAVPVKVEWFSKCHLDLSMTFHPPLSVQSPTTRHTKSKGKAATGPRHAELSRMQTALHQSPAVRRLQVLQRITINMDPGDNAIAPAAMISLAREKSGTLTASPPNPDAREYQRDPADKSKPLSAIWESEQINVVSHGVPTFGGEAPMVGGLNPGELLGYLVGLGLTAKHTGTINLSACTTSWGRRGEASFAKQFNKILQQSGFVNTVTGFESFTMSVDEDTEEEVEHGQREAALALFMATRMIYILGEADQNNLKDVVAAITKLCNSIKSETDLQVADGWLDEPKTERITVFYYKVLKLCVDFLASPYLETAGEIASDVTNLKRENTMHLAGRNIDHVPAMWVIEL